MYYIYLPVRSCCDDLTLVWPVAYRVEHGVSKYHLAAHQLAASVQVYYIDAWEETVHFICTTTLHEVPDDACSICTGSHTLR